MALPGNAQHAMPGGSQTVPVWSPAGKASSILSCNSTTPPPAEVWPADGGRQVRTMIDRSWRPGSADAPVGSHLEWVAEGMSALPGNPQHATPGGSQTVPVWSPAGKASSTLSHYPTTPPLRELSPCSAGQTSCEPLLIASPFQPDQDGLATNRVSARALRSSAGSTSSSLLLYPTHNGPPTSHGGARPRAAARPSVLRTSDPRAGPKGPRAAAREVVLRSVSRRGRRRSQGDGPLATGFASIPQQRGAAITILIPRTLHSPQPSTSPHLQANRPQAHGPRSTHNGPPTSHGGARPRAAARPSVLRTSDPRAGPKGPRAAAREVVLRSVSRRGRRRSQGDGPLATGFASIPQQRGAAITILIPRTLHSPQPSTSPHLQANRPQAHGPRSTHSGPPTSHGATRPRAAARPSVLRTSDPRAGPKGPRAAAREVVPRDGAPRLTDLWPPASPVSRNNAVQQLRF
jgi:hypothetical protein